MTKVVHLTLCTQKTFDGSTNGAAIHATIAIYVVQVETLEKVDLMETDVTRKEVTANL